MALHDPHVYADAGQAADRAGSTTRDTFGRFLLFKRLRQDGLGEVYRAGVMSENAVERVVSLRLFNGGEINGQTFLNACQARKGVESILRGGAFGEVVDLGCEGGVAYVAHDFVFGRSLAELLEKTRDSSQPVPLEHTLHIMDRVAIGLQNAQSKRHDEQRILHGFLTPDFVHVSSEGEIQLTGFELSPALLELPVNGGARAHLAGYISPEVNAGQPPTAADDVYSLGALFAELLTGEPLPALNPAESSRWVESAQVAAEGAPLPADVRHLLRESLLPRAQRIQKAELWHQALVEITNASEHISTTFDLAFFVNTLLGDQIDRDVRDVEAERQAEVPPPEPPQPVPVAPTPAAATPAETPEVERPEPAAPPPGEAATEAPTEALQEPVVEGALFTEPAGLDTPSAPRAPIGTQSRSQAAPASGPDKRLIAAVAAVVVAGLAVGYLVNRSTLKASSDPVQVSVAPRVDTHSASATEGTSEDGVLTDLPDVAPPLAPEEIESQVRSLVARRAGALEANLKAEYDERLVKLRKQLEVAREAATGAPEPIEQAPTQAAVTPPERLSPAAAAVNRPPVVEPASLPTREPVTEATEPGPPANRPADPKPTTPVPAESQTPDRAPARSAAATPKVSQPAAQPRPPAVEPGSLVEQGPGVEAPKLTRQPEAIYPPAAARLKRQATVKLRVLVDETGKTVEVEQLGKAVGMGFDQAALKAARNTQWTPPSKDGVPVKMWVELSIDFRP